MSSELLTLTGAVTIRERIALPPGAIATIKLVDAEGEVLAGTAVDVTGIPTEFTVSADPEFIADPDGCSSGPRCAPRSGSGAPPISCPSMATRSRCSSPRSRTDAPGRSRTQRHASHRR
ncbi:YbaY family lipoprotein [Aeromicrobium sp. UC242_57]|uniref:YbaY family lipoprotein n=1 Tax=Aeromicrobium sp. UC242_57 TaxID=3374624 RepID=UPI0037A3F906